MTEQRQSTGSLGLAIFACYLGYDLTVKAGKNTYNRTVSTFSIGCTKETLDALDVERRSPATAVFLDVYEKVSVGVKRAIQSALRAPDGMCAYRSSEHQAENVVPVYKRPKWREDEE